MVRLHKFYRETVVPRLRADLKIENAMQVPRITKIVINVGMGEGAKNPRLVDAAAEELAIITGQKAVITRAKKAIANFGLRVGLPVGASVTLRGARMYEFLDRFINLTVPRIRDFRGLPNRSFDGRGNFAMGIKEHIIFPEINYDDVDEIWGMDVIVCTTAASDDEARALLKAFDFPFRQ